MSARKLTKKPKRLRFFVDQAVKAYLAEIGRKGGRATSAAKTAAARLNGSKGGRPRKTPPPAPAPAPRSASRLQVERQRKREKFVRRRVKSLKRHPSMEFAMSAAGAWEVPPEVRKVLG